MKMKTEENRVKVIFFDIGGVLYKDIEKYMMRDIAKDYKLSYTKVMNIRGKWWNLFATGKISEKEYWEGFLKDAGIYKDWKKFRKLPYDKYIVSVKGMIPIVCKLHKKYRLFIISDHAREWFSYAFKKSPFALYFEGLFLSYEHQSLKEERKLFQKAIKSVKVKPSEILFVDNSQKNILIAKNLGMQTILFKSVKQFQKEIT